MPRWPGGLIRKTPVTPAGPLQSGAAPGMWTLAEATYWTKQGLWPIAGNSLRWIGRLSSGTEDVVQSIATDSVGNVYLAGWSLTSGSRQFQLSKFNQSGTIQWQSRVTGTEAAYSILVADDNTIYVAGVDNGSNFCLIQFNAAGAIQWQRKLDFSTSFSIAKDIATDTSGNVYLTGSDGGNILTVKYSSSGTIQWQKKLAVSSGTSSGEAIGVDASGNCYICGGAITGGKNYIVLAKYNTSGTLQWRKNIGQNPALGSNSAYGYAIAVTGGGDIYLGGYYTSNFTVLKYSTSGTVQWARELTSGGTCYAIALDSSENVYVGGSGSSGGTPLGFIFAKYSPSGSIQWQRKLYRTTTWSSQQYAMTTDGIGNIYVAGVGYNGSGSDTGDFLFAKLPSDGTLTGTYSVGGVSYTYAASSLTEVASGVGEVSISFSDTFSSLTGSSTSYATATTTLTSSVTTL